MKTFGILLVIIIPLFAGSQVLEGTVYGNDDHGQQPLPGVNIYWEGTSRGVASNVDGTFEINKRNSDHILVFSFVGYEKKEIHVHNLNPVVVVLEPNLELGEVTVVQKDRGTYLSTINPIQTEHIGGAEFHKAACCNLAESFETNASTDVTYSDAVTGARQIRLLGLEGIYSLLQIENMPNLRGLGTNFGLTYIPGPWMESIQVSKGTASVLNGYESITGQINAEYKKPDSQEKLFINSYAGASGRFELNGNSNIRINKDNLTTGIFIHVSDQSKRNDENSDGFLDEPLFRQIQLFNRWKFNNHKGFMAQAGFKLLSEDRTGGQVTFEKGMQPFQSNPYGVNIKTERLEGFFKTGYVWPDNRTAIAWLSNFSRHETNSFYGLNIYDAGETRFYGSSVLTRDLSAEGIHSVNTGFSYIYDGINEYLYSNEIDRTEKVPGIFAEYTFKPDDHLTFMTGIRTDFHNFFGTFITPRAHLRYKMGEHVTLRASAGKGYRTANVLAENIYLLASSRSIQWADDVFQEKAWNYGLVLVQNYSLWGRNLQLNTEYFRTDFQNQVIVDRESSATNIILAPLSGRSFANSIQLDIRYQPVERLDMLLAYRINDVKQTIAGQLLEKPLTNRYKGLINLNYTTNLKKWMFDYTIQFNGGGRIPHWPDQAEAQAPGQSDDYEFSPFTIMNAQITKYFRYWNIYLGSENLTNFKQKNPVSGISDPYGPEFDATNIWGPVKGRRIYIGIRFKLDYEIITPPGDHDHDHH